MSHRPSSNRDQALASTAAVLSIYHQHAVLCASNRPQLGRAKTPNKRALLSVCLSVATSNSRIFCVLLEHTMATILTHKLSIGCALSSIFTAAKTSKVNRSTRTWQTFRNTSVSVRFQVLTATGMKMVVFWDVASGRDW
jgi:hypothetical protein